jgi:hypothetical protein
LLQKHKRGIFPVVPKKQKIKFKIMKNFSQLQLKSFRRVEYIAIALLLTFVWLIPAILLSSERAGASQLTSRFLRISSAVPSGTSVQYTYGFTYVSSASAIQSIKFVACTTALGTYGQASTSSTTGCTAPTGLNINQGTQQGTVGGSWTNTTGFTRDTSTIGFCAPAANVMCITRTQAAAESAAAKTITWNTQTNPSTANSSWFVGMYLYSATNYGTPTDSGTVASAVVQTLTVNAAVAEVLNFCVGSTTVNDATTTVASDCTGVGGTSLNLGTLDTSAVSTSPVAASPNGGDAKNGVAMLRTNAASGATVSYDSIQQAGTNQRGTLRISGTTNCSATVTDLTDQCIRAQGATQGTFTAGAERFGMTIGGTNCANPTTNSAYTCVYASGTEHLVPSSNYVGATGAYGTTNGFAWVDDGTVTQIASSTTVVADEALMLRFAATPSITTPFGAYTAQADFIAVPTY